MFRFAFLGSFSSVYPMPCFNCQMWIILVDILCAIVSNWLDLADGIFLLLFSEHLYTTSYRRYFGLARPDRLMNLNINNNQWIIVHSWRRCVYGEVEIRLSSSRTARLSKVAWWLNQWNRSILRLFTTHNTTHQGSLQNTHTHSSEHNTVGPVAEPGARRDFETGLGAALPDSEPMKKTANRNNNIWWFFLCCIVDDFLTLTRFIEIFIFSFYSRNR